MYESEYGVCDSRAGTWSIWASVISEGKVPWKVRKMCVYGMSASPQSHYSILYTSIHTRDWIYVSMGNKPILPATWAIEDFRDRVRECRRYEENGCKKWKFRNRLKVLRNSCNNDDRSYVRIRLIWLRYGPSMRDRSISQYIGLARLYHTRTCFGQKSEIVFGECVYEVDMRIHSQSHTGLWRTCRRIGLSYVESVIPIGYEMASSFGKER